ncbi:unnamed protein product [Rotaria magnacalcarata]|uniref:Uncharacterized protein n=1 Tax=Rotaria magnacalcarata TaxID=392030 RepID=A0A816WHJ6_9BILA|nr:unnamed protein product [Rotaria magnacalcarata]CAF4241239.1 unnamed protein product [Rotaria magnacalcarata]
MMSNELNTSDEENKPVKNQANDINYLKLENVRLTNELAALKMEMVQMANLMKKFKVDKGKQSEDTLKLKKKVEDLKTKLDYCREHGVYQDDSSNSPPLMKK